MPWFLVQVNNPANQATISFSLEMSANVTFRGVSTRKEGTVQPVIPIARYPAMLATIQNPNTQEFTPLAIDLDTTLRAMRENNILQTQMAVGLDYTDTGFGQVNGVTALAAQFEDSTITDKRHLYSPDNLITRSPDSNNYVRNAVFLVSQSPVKIEGQSVSNAGMAGTGLRGMQLPFSGVYGAPTDNNTIDEILATRPSIVVDSSLSDGQGNIDVIGYFDPCPPPDVVRDDDTFQDADRANRIGWVRSGNDMTDDDLKNYNMEKTGPIYVTDYTSEVVIPALSIETNVSFNDVPDGWICGTLVGNPGELSQVSLWEPMGSPSGISPLLFRDLPVNNPQDGVNVSGAPNYNSQFQEYITFKVYDVTGALVLNTNTKFRNGVDKSGMFDIELHFVIDALDSNKKKYYYRVEFVTGPIEISVYRDICNMIIGLTARPIYYSSIQFSPENADIFMVSLMGLLSPSNLSLEIMTPLN